MSPFPAERLAAVAIGRNEGDRLRACLDSLKGRVARIVYVDSGSTDGSAEMARARGVEVVDLDLSRPFTAARARNEGFARLCAISTPEFVQFVDGDCEVQPGWIDTAAHALQADPRLAVACGRRRERHPGASVYNRLIDHEWNTPVGPALACGGDALIRTCALQQIGGFNPALIAGEEPEMCLRLREAGWTILRLDAEMTLHDAAITRFGQWWKRTRRGGYAFAEGAALHGRSPQRHWVRQTQRALLWGFALPVGILLAAVLVSPWALLLLLVYPLQLLRLIRRETPLVALFQILSKFPEAQGAIEYILRRGTGRRRGLIEYK